MSRRPESMPRLAWASPCLKPSRGTLGFKLVGGRKFDLLKGQYEEMNICLFV
jgi:hypothetical protein